MQPGCKKTNCQLIINYFCNCIELKSYSQETNSVYVDYYSYNKYYSFLQQLCFFLTIAVVRKNQNCCKINF